MISKFLTENPNSDNRQLKSVKPKTTIDVSSADEADWV